MLDSTFGIGSESWVIFHKLNKNWDMIECKLENQYSFTDVTPFYNGREKWICVTISSVGKTNERLSVSFGEHRNSDNLCVDVFTPISVLNPPHVDMLTDEVYNNRKYFNYGQYDEVVEFITDTFINFIDKSLGEIAGEKQESILKKLTFLE